MPGEISFLEITQPTPGKKVLKRPEIEIENFPKRFFTKNTRFAPWLLDEIKKGLSQK